MFLDGLLAFCETMGRIGGGFPIQKLDPQSILNPSPCPDTHSAQYRALSADKSNLLLCICQNSSDCGDQLATEVHKKW